jgi:ABC-2 type transport system permease protein
MFASIGICVYLLFGYFLGVDFSNANFISAIIIFILTIVSFSSIGIISAAFVIIFKRGDPISLTLAMFATVFGGVYFPITVLPKSLQSISNILPITYSLRTLRYALLQGYNLKMLSFDIGILFIFCIILFPLSLLIFKYAVKKAKKDGTLAYY